MSNYAQFGLMSFALITAGCMQQRSDMSAVGSLPKPDFVLTSSNSHNKFSRTIPPVLRVHSGAVIDIYTKEATDGQLTVDSTVDDLRNVDADPIHPLTGPIFVEGARVGDVLAVELLEIEIGDWGWSAVFEGFGLLSDEFNEPYLKTFHLKPGASEVQFAPNIHVPLRPFPGVMGVAPDTDELLSTIPPRANGGNMDNPYMTIGTTVYFPVLVEGALFSIGDTHATQGMGEVCGTAIEAPMRILLRLEVLKGRRQIPEPQYETQNYYAVTAYAPDLDEAAKKATRYMVDYLEAEYGLTRVEAYVLCSLAGDLHIAEVVDVPNMLVAMHIPKHIFGRGTGRN